jgi:pimeloyl-ACP methyl ester carboxylesterase
MQKIIFLPGIITPAAVVYAPLLEALQSEIEPVLKELEIYTTETPPPDYSLDLEVDAILRLLDYQGLDAAHFVGYSGGAAILLAFTAAHSQRVRSLAVFEPATIPAQAWMQSEQNEWDEYARIMQLPEDQRTAAFLRAYMRPGVTPPALPSGDPPPWMAQRPAGMKAFTEALRVYDLPLDGLRSFERPVYLSYGLQSRTSEEQKAEFLAALFPKAELEAYQDLHHFKPPQRHAPERFARALRRLWERT